MTYTHLSTCSGTDIIVAVFGDREAFLIEKFYIHIWHTGELG
jgi:hypothetical protein